MGPFLMIGQRAVELGGDRLEFVKRLAGTVFGHFLDVCEPVPEFLGREHVSTRGSQKEWASDESDQEPTFLG